ncbi:hypothetical protein [Caballeronia sp. BR00000012568055]|uniref:hypothetical protein n=1 Tax=Caballeronia sp. BR00000012568055 TaxID=2918761 RepID=UPI0023FA3976|nr:hypothetical protein [Caballeronia sp. BR00000012568055]
MSFRAFIYGVLRVFADARETRSSGVSPFSPQHNKTMCRYPNDMCAIPHDMENVICLSAALRLVSNDKRVFVTTSELSVDLERAESHR